MTYEGYPIAVVGISGRFPGAHDIDEFWDHLLAGEESIRRFNNDADLAMGVGMQRSQHVAAYGVLDGIENFDADFFGYSPREAEFMDPQHRLFLECAWAALEDAACPPGRYGRQTGVFAACSASGYLISNLIDLYQSGDELDRDTILIGNDKDYLATRLSYKLGLRGPSIMVQTACSSSLVALHQACLNLAAGECDIAVVGGVSIGIPQLEVHDSGAGGIRSGDGYCRPFDANASGTVRGNGVGIVVLRRVADAVRERNPVKAVILGSAVNNDGSSKAGYTAPGFDGQVEVISAALRRAGVGSDQIGFVEAHGTGTPVGDPLEAAALLEAFDRFRVGPPHPRSCVVGSVKGNLGHLDAAAGIAGFIKAVLCVERGIVPGTLHFTSPNPEITWDDSPFFVTSGQVAWPQEGRRHACVSSFGIGGTNAHVVIASPESVPAGSAPRKYYHLLPISARSPKALDNAVENLRRYLSKNPDVELADVAFTLQRGRSPFECRRVLVGESVQDVMQALQETPTAGPVPPRHMDAARPGVVFMFPGQGAQYPGMASHVADLPVVRKEIDTCADLLADIDGPDIRGALTGHDKGSDETLLAQPAIFSFDYALARMWQSLGVEPSAMIGHSVGEYVAAVLAGVLSLRNALQLVTARARLMQDAPRGSMLAVPLSPEEVQPFTEGQVDLAAVNAPSVSVLAGDGEQIEAIQQRLGEAGIASRILRTSHAFHSRLMQECMEPFGSVVNGIDFHAPEIPYISTLTGNWISASQVRDPAYWVQHMRCTVAFSPGIECLLANGSQIFLEVGPGQTLGAAVSRFRSSSREITVLQSTRHPNDKTAAEKILLAALGGLWAAGIDVRWDNLLGAEGRAVSLPTYPFQSQRYWRESPHRQGNTGPGVARSLTISQTATTPSIAIPGEKSAGKDLAKAPPGGGRSADYREAVRAILQEILGVKEIKDDDSFFHLGGDSLIALQACIRLRKTLDVSLSLREFLDHASVSGLAEILAERVQTPGHGQPGLTEDTQPCDLLAAATAEPRANAEPYVVAQSGAYADPSAASNFGSQPLQFSIFFFSADASGADNYSFICDCARMADDLGYTAVWTPERHFHQFGGLYPNPSVLSAALAMVTRRIGLRAGSIVAPLHHPARIAEEWSVVDNLSRGRVGISFASGFHPIDFVLSRETYDKRVQVTYDRIDQVRKLWRGEAIPDISRGEKVDIAIYPRPFQNDVPMWLTTGGRRESFATAGRMGIHVLTALLGLSWDDLADRIKLYRDERARSGHDPETGIVTVMLHTYLGTGRDEEIRATLREPFNRYLWTHMELVEPYAKSIDPDLRLDELTDGDKQTLLDFAFDRYYESDSLMGGRDRFLERAKRLHRIGVNEAACLIDFGLPAQDMLASLERVAQAANFSVSQQIPPVSPDSC
jgi:phthiocerol/phenolphthiocerol synthesis type-I polyketide synthase E